MDAESFAMTRGLEIALDSPMAPGAPAICICLHNLSVAKNAGKIPNGSSQATFIKFREPGKSWLAKEGKTLTVQWIPGHESIKGNEIADARIRKSKDVAWQLEWEKQRQTGAPLLYLELGLKPTSKRKKLAPQLNIKREVAARSGHHQRFSREEEEDWRCSCGNYRAPLHPCRCTNARAHRALLWSEKAKRALSTEEILSTLEGAAAFAKWAPETGLFHWRSGVWEQGETDP